MTGESGSRGDDPRPVSLERAVVLCGGPSRRMGTPKAFLPLGDRTLLRRLVDGLGRVVGRVGVSVSPELRAALDRRGELADLIPSVVDIYTDSRPWGGPLEGIRTSLGRMPEERAFFVAVDTPSVWWPLVEILREASLGPGRRGAAFRWRGRVEPLFAIYSRSLLDDLEALLVCGGRRARDLGGLPGVSLLDLDPGKLAQHLAPTRSRPIGDPFINLNEERDYERVRQAFEAGTFPREAVLLG